MLEAQTADIRALLFLSPSPTFQDFKEAWHAAPRRPDACLTVARRRIRRFSLIHDACPAGVDRQAYTQALFNAALACLGSRDKEPGAASDEAVLFALLLLFHTQRCEPRVQVYLPLREQPLLTFPRLLTLRRAGKLLRIACIAQSAAEREDAELLTVLRTLLAESALVAGAAEVRCLQQTDSRSSSRRPSCPDCPQNRRLPQQPPPPRGLRRRTTWPRAWTPLAILRRRTRWCGHAACPRAEVDVTRCVSRPRWQQPMPSLLAPAASTPTPPGSSPSCKAR